MKTARKLFEEYIDKATREWWATIPKPQAHPFHTSQISWENIPESCKWTMYGLYVDHLRGIGISDTTGKDAVLGWVLDSHMSEIFIKYLGT